MGPWKRFSKSKLSLSGEGTYGSSSRSNDSDDDVLSPLNSDLQQTIHDQNQIIEIHQHTIEELKEEKELLQSQVWNFSDQLTQSRGEIDTRRTEIGTLDKQLRSSRARVQVVEERIDEQSQELASQSNTIKTLSGHNQKLQNQVADLEALVSVAASDTGTGFRGLLTQYSELKRAHGKMALKLQSEEEMRLALDERLTEMQSENDSLKLAINELQKEASSLETCQPQTLRDLLTLRLVEQTWNEEKKDGTSGEPTQAQNWLPSGLSRKLFDEVCSPAEIQRLAKTFPKSRSFNQFYQQLKLTMCATCSKAKFSFKVDAHPTFKSMAWLNEYVGKNRYFSCCHEEVCKECFKKHLLATLETKWWYKLDTLQWFPCPRDACENALGIRCEADLETCLEQFCSNEAEQHVKTYVSGVFDAVGVPLTEFSGTSKH
jgi:predicted nuclease with TOPRIM domain